jgi:hypothetical protein
LRILTIVTGLKSDSIVNSNKVISYPDRLTQDANSGDKSDEEIKSTLLPNGNPVILIITENQRREWYINALKANPLNIFKSLISLLETEPRPFRDTMTMVQARYTKYLDEKTKKLSEENKILKIQKLVPKGNSPNVTKLNTNKKRSIDNITPSTPKVTKEAKLYCKICDFNSTHITNDCKKLSKLILDQTNKPVVQKINKDIKIEKPIKSDNKVSKDTKIKSKPKVNNIKIDYCAYCLKFGQSERIFKSHNFKGCTRRPSDMSRKALQSILANNDNPSNINKGTEANASSPEFEGDSSDSTVSMEASDDDEDEDQNDSQVE